MPTDLIQQTKTCTKCGIEKNLSEFAIRRDRIPGFHSNCRACCSVSSKNWHDKTVAKNKQSLSPSPANKACTICDIIKDISEFSRCLGSKDGFNSFCKECSRTGQKRTRRALRVSRRLTGNYEQVDGKKCSGCEIYKDRSQFTKSLDTKDALNYYCKACQNSSSYNWRKRNPEKHRLSLERYKLNHPGKVYIDSKNSAWKSVGVKNVDGSWFTCTDYEILLIQQNHQCKICGAVEPGNGKKKMFVDHNHDTGIVRGLLCNPCNVGLGNFRDRIDLLRLAINYLDVNIETVSKLQ